MRDFVNFGLLFSFLTLAVTGVLAFVRPFSLPLTRVHIIFGTATLILVGLHLGSRLWYFREQVKFSSPNGISKSLLAGITLVWAGLLWSGLSGGFPARLLINQGYEAKHRDEIVRPSVLVASLAERDQLVTSRVAQDTDTVALSLHAAFNPGMGEDTALAVWAESTAGTLIETLYVSPGVAFSDRPSWGGAQVQRADVLPIWRNRYTALTGVEPDGERDGMSGATEHHQFSLDAYLSVEDEGYVICLEINVPADSNEHWTDPVLGQPSVLYTGLVDVGSGPRYVLLELTGQGGTGAHAGAIRYDLDTLDSAKQLVEVALVRNQPIAK